MCRNCFSVCPLQWPTSTLTSVGQLHVQTYANVSPQQAPTSATVCQAHAPTIKFAAVSQPNVPTCAVVSPVLVSAHTTVFPSHGQNNAFATVSERYVPKLFHLESTTKANLDTYLFESTTCVNKCHCESKTCANQCHCE